MDKRITNLDRRESESEGGGFGGRCGGGGATTIGRCLLMDGEPPKLSLHYLVGSMSPQVINTLSCTLVTNIITYLFAINTCSLGALQHVQKNPKFLRVCSLNFTLLDK